MAEAASSSSIPAAAPAPASGEERTFDKALFDSVELVYQRLTKGRHDLKRLKAYMEARGEMARSWVKSMKKASEQPDLEDSSSISAVWKDIRDTGAAQMKQQEAFAAGCHDISVALETQIVEVKKTKTTLQATWTKLVADVKKKQQVHDKAKDQYYESVKQAETAVMNRDAAHEQKMPDKAVQKAETRAKQTLKEVETLHAAYQKAVQQLQESQQTHDVTVVDLLQQFERLERNRMKVFLDQLDRFANQHDALKANIEQVTASLHQNVQAVNIANDIQAFINTNATNKPPSPHVTYIPCKSSIIDHAMDLKPTNSGTMPIRNSFIASNTASLPTSSAASSQQQPAGSSGSFNQPPSPAAAVVAATAAAAAVAPAVSASPATGETAVALFDFEKNEPDDLGFKTGEIIKLLSSPDNEDWWQGEKDGQVGIFPKAYVQKQGGAGGAAAAPAAPPAAAPAAPAVEVASTPSNAGPVSHTPAAAPPPPAAVSVVNSNPFGGPAPAAASSNPFGDDADSFGAPANGEGAAHASPVAEGEGHAGAEGAEVPKKLDAVCSALFDFDGQDEDELSFKAGQTLIITGELNGWYLGRCDGSEKVGIFPSNYVSMK